MELGHVRDFLHEMFTERCIGRNEPCDLTLYS